MEGIQEEGGGGIKTPSQSAAEMFGSAMVALIVRTGTDDGYDPAAAAPDADGKGVNYLPPPFFYPSAPSLL